MTFYNKASAGFIEQNLDTRLYEVLYPSLFNISAILGDDNGLIGINTAAFLTKDVNYSEDGAVFLNILGSYSSVSEEKGKHRDTEYMPHHTDGVVPMTTDIYVDSQVRVYDINPKQTIEDSLAPLRFRLEKHVNKTSRIVETFSGTMTNQGFNALLATIDKMEVLVDSYNLGEIDSPMLIRAIECFEENSNALLAVKIVYLELLSIFVTLSKTDKDFGINTISIDDLNLVANNINSISDYIADMEMSWTTQELTEILRDAYKAVKTITLSDSLFKETYSVRYHGIYTGGVDA